MRIKINVLSEIKLNFYNLLLSHWSILLENINYFEDNGIKITFFNNSDEDIYKCDILIISSRYFYNNNFSNKYIIDSLKKYKKKISNIIWFDLRDSAGTTQFEVMPYVKTYVKGQIYRDFSNYRCNLYGGRMYSDYYHKKYSINDKEIYKMHPLSKDDEKKIKIGWNLGVIRYDYLNNINALKKIFYKNISFKKISKIQEVKFIKDIFKKKYRMFSVFNSNFPRASVEFQRKLAIKKLKKIKHRDDLFDIKLSKSDYTKKINLSKYVLSCYGWGEVCYRDWEAVFNNSLIIKPNMSNIDTWPNLYQEYKTYIPISWDLSDLQTQIEKLENNFYDINNIKNNAFDVYKSIRSNDYFVFRKKFLEIINLAN